MGSHLQILSVRTSKPYEVNPLRDRCLWPLLNAKPSRRLGKFTALNTFPLKTVNVTDAIQEMPILLARGIVSRFGPPTPVEKRPHKS
jgi:hypothetical protein